MREIDQLHPELQKKINQLITKCNNAGLKIGISECLRTVQEQDALYAKGRTAPGNKVTNAKGSTYSSMHQWGVAFDFYRNDGNGAYNNKDGFFDKVGKIGVAIGLEWGGNWKSIIDKPHFQLPDWGSTSSILKSQYGTPEKFFKTWNIQIEPGVELTEKKFRTIKGAFLRCEPVLNETTKVPYNVLSATLKKKCSNKKGYAFFNAGYTFIRVRSYTDEVGNSWKKIKSGYWMCTTYDGEKRVEALD